MTVFDERRARRLELLAKLLELEGFGAAAQIVRHDITGYATWKRPELKPGEAPLEDETAELVDLARDVDVILTGRLFESDTGLGVRPVTPQGPGLADRGRARLDQTDAAIAARETTRRRLEGE